MTVVILLCIRALSVKFYVLVNVRFPICIKTDLRTLCTFVPTRFELIENASLTSKATRQQ